MNDGDFTTAFTVDQSPEEVFAANIVAPGGRARSTG
jgi:hypothetical protein